MIVEHLLENYGRFMAALCIWREARGENLEAKRGVYWTLINRAASHPSPWPADLAGVVLQPHQFSSFSGGDPNALKFPACTDAALADCCAVVDDPGNDPTGGAVYYESFPADKLDAIRPYEPWFAVDKLTVQLGALRFYRR
jgi:hypothetical protein